MANFFSWKKNQWFKSHSWIFIKISTKSVSWLGSDQYIFFLWFFQNIMFLYLQMRKGKEICPGWLWNIYQQRNIYMLGSTSKRDWSRMDMENTIINLSSWRKGKALTIKKDTKELWWQKHCIRIRILVISISIIHLQCVIKKKDGRSVDVVSWTFAYTSLPSDRVTHCPLLQLIN